jgi:predicted membrane channel-forming protein YqfA (hemolysin III family)
VVTRNVSRLEKLGAPPWVRGLGVVLLALILVGNLAFITFSWVPRGGARVYAILVFLWILALVALLFLLRLWRATVSPERWS